MYNVIYAKKQNIGYGIVNQYTDDYYAPTIEKAFDIFDQLLNVKLISVGYAYKYLGLFWQIDLMINSHDQYKTLKQLSLEWFKK